MTAERSLLVFGLSEAEMINLSKENLTLRVIHPGNAGATLGELIEGKEIPHTGKPLSEVKIIIFSGYETNEELKEVITAIRREHVFGSIMAVMTQTNVNWKFDYFMEHLLEEREENRKIENERRKKTE
jgi:hypothetical protein